MDDVKKMPELGFGEALKQAMDKLTQFSGRSRRSEFWWCMLAVIIANVVLSFIPFIGSIGSLLLSLAVIPLTFRRLHDTGRSGWWCGIGVIGTIIGYGVIAYNLVDVIGSDMLMEIAKGEVSDPTEIADTITNSSAGFLPMTISYLIGMAYNIMMIVFMCLDSQVGTNKYGPSPKYMEQGEINN